MWQHTGKKEQSPHLWFGGSWNLGVLGIFGTGWWWCFGFLYEKKITETTMVLKLNNIASFLEVTDTILLCIFLSLSPILKKKKCFFSHILSRYHPKNSFFHSHLSVWLKETMHFLFSSSIQIPTIFAEEHFYLIQNNNTYFCIFAYRWRQKLPNPNKITDPCTFAI